MESSEVNNVSCPKLFVFDGGDWNEYQEALYRIFLATIYDNKLIFQGLPVNIKRHPEYRGKHFTFWHLTSSGEREEERVPDFRRCERLEWVSWMILNCENTSEITYWENKRGEQKHIVIWHEKENYAVILAKRSGYFLLKTAYYLDRRRADSFRRDRSMSKEKKS